MDSNKKPYPEIHVFDGAEFVRVVDFDDARTCLKRRLAEVEGAISFEDMQKFITYLQNAVRCYRAVLEGMEFKGIDAMPSDGVPACTALGQEAAQIIKGVQAERDALRNAPRDTFPLRTAVEALKKVSAERDAAIAREAALREDLDSLKHWRDLALQFDNHRMRALWHLKTLVSDGAHYEAAAAFLAEPPIPATDLQQRLTVAEQRAVKFEGLMLQTNELLYQIQGDPGAVPSSSVDAMRGEVFTALKPGEEGEGS